MGSSATALRRRGVSARIKSIIYQIFREITYARGRDVTRKLLECARTLVIAPHPDDETLGCGAVIARLRAAGNSVRVIVVTDGSVSHNSRQISPQRLAEIRAAEVVAAGAELGVPAGDIHCLGFLDREIEVEDPALGRRISEEIADFDPDQIFYPSGVDRHPDHRVVAEVVEGLLRAGAQNCVAWAYPVWFWRVRDWILPGGVRQRLKLKVVKVATEGFLPEKRSALSHYRSQFENLTGEPGWHVLGPDISENALGRYEIFFQFNVLKSASQADES